MNKPVFFDIETVPEPFEAIKRVIPEFDPDDVKIGNLVDEAKIIAKITAAKQEFEAAYFDKAALRANTGRVAMIGYLVEDEFIYQGLDKCDEKTDLMLFWEKAQECMTDGTKMVGFNINEFDLPFIVRRSWKHGIPVPRLVRHGRYWHDCFVDLMQEWLMGERSPAKGTSSLDGLAKYFGIEGKKGSGADFWKMPLKQQIAYSEQDLRITQELWRRMA